MYRPKAEGRNSTHMVRTYRKHDAWRVAGVAGAWRECDFNQEQVNNPGGRTDPTASELSIMGRGSVRSQV